MTELHATDKVFISKITEIVLCNLDKEDFGVKELIQNSGLSRHILSQKLRSINNQSINQFIREIRLQKALEMLKNGKVTASEVAYKVGFSSPAYFSTCFNEYFGFTPGQVKKEDFLYNAESKSKPVEVTTNSKQKRHIWRTIIFISSSLLLLVILSYLASNLFFKDIPGNVRKFRNKPEISVAVLPFENLSDSSSNRYFIDGVMGEILSDLSKIKDLHVVSRISVEQFRGSTKSASEIAKILHVNFIVEGRCQKYDNIFRLRVSITDAKNDKQIWAKSYQKELKEATDIYITQSEIAQSIASELKATVTPEEKRIIEKIPTSNLTAYNLYQRANSELYRLPYPYYNKEIIKKAEILFLEALKCDSNYAQAYVGLSNVLWKRWYHDNTLVSDGNIKYRLDSMLILANKALNIDKQIAEAYRVRGEYYSVEGSTEQALDEWEKALRYNPNDGWVYSLIGGFYEELDMVKSFENLQNAAFLLKGPELTQTLTALGLDYYKAGFPEQGNYFLREVLNLDDDSVNYYNNTVNYTARTMGYYEKALEHYEKRYKTDSTNEATLRLLAYYNSLSGHDKESLKYYKLYLSVINARDESNSLYTRYSRIGYAYYRCGYAKEAEYYFKRQIETCKDRLTSVRPGERIYWLYPLAGAYVCMGDKNKAYESLREFNHAQSFTLEWVTLLRTDPIFNTIRGEPEFQKILSDVSAKYQKEHERVRNWLDGQRKLRLLALPFK
jgi:TolB-like protein/AraC-like DNA-binding protein